MNDVVVTGLGTITPVGGSLSETWESLLGHESGAGPITQFDLDTYGYDFRTRVGCEVAADPSAHPSVDERSAGRHAQFGVVAASEAVADAGFDADDGPDWDPTRAGVSYASCLGGQLEIDEHQLRMRDGGRPDTRFSIQSLTSSVAGHASVVFDARGPNRAPSTACAAGTHAIADAVDDVRLGRADVMIAGGADAGVCSTGLAAFDSLRAMSSRNDAPTAAIRPFDADRDGFLLGEGAGALVLESASHAAERGATAYAAVTGVGRSADADHLIRPASDGRGLIAAIERALADADRSPADVDHVNAHATATPRGDDHEALCLHEVFDDPPPVTANKGNVGHTLGASGAIEGAISAASIHEGTIPPTVNHETPDCGVDVVTEPRDADPEVVLANSAGFGGTNGAVVFERV
ncbi:beta-ketoacyl synthase [Halobaculum sp. MBLA0143]|uniref:beta-ketoacyl-[acyl-carrier-protein] synthase family protein n=1 Tax=Halobaculum sp. MBLA0143 TaxID=3079933 RepID=UPI0035252A0A